MVERKIYLNNVFHSLADPTRRDILRRVSKQELSIGAVAQPYPLSFAAIAKHIRVLEHAQLIKKRREGKEQRIQIMPRTIEDALSHLGSYEKQWQSRFDALDQLLKK